MTLYTTTEFAQAFADSLEAQGVPLGDKAEFVAEYALELDGWLGGGEAIPAELGARVTEAVEVATIGIGAGPEVDGQVLVITDLLGLTPDPTPRFVKRYADLRAEITEAAGRIAKDVAEGHYPAPEHQDH